MKTKTKTKQAFVEKDEGITPELLHTILPVTATVLRSFGSQKEMVGYRRMIYSINKQGTYRYRTIRAETEMWGIVIWRML